MTMHNALSAVEAARKIRAGSLSSADLVKACLARIDETDGQLKAWVHLDPEHALAQAEEMDVIRRGRNSEQGEKQGGCYESHGSNKPYRP